MCSKSFEHNKKHNFLIKCIYVLARWSHIWWTFFLYQTRNEGKQTIFVAEQTLNTGTKSRSVLILGLFFQNRLIIAQAKLYKNSEDQTHNESKLSNSRTLPDPQCFTFNCSNYESTLLTSICGLKAAVLANKSL